MSKGIIVLGTLIVLGASFTLFASTSASNSVPLTKCQKKLDTSSYQCDVAQAGDPESTFQQCFTVTPQTPTDELFTLGPFLGRNWVCECDSTGDPGNAKFGKRDSHFVCAAEAAEVCGTYELDGAEIAGGFRCQINHGGQSLDMQGVGSFAYDSVGIGPQSFVAECQRVESCSD